MKNIIRERPSSKLIGRLKKTFDFVDIQDIKGKAILDIGCGYGWFEWNAFKKGAKEITGVEISESNLSTIKKYIKNKKFTPLVGHATEIPSGKNIYDTVVAWEVIEHIPNKSENQFFHEVNRVLKKGGSFYISTPYDVALSTYLDPAFWLIGHRHYSEKKLRQYGLKNKFTIEKVAVVGGIWTAISVINMYVSKWAFRRERFFKEFFYKKENEEYEKEGFYNIFIKYKKK